MEINIRYVICGDFNYDLLKQEFNANINEFIDVIFFLQLCIIKPTQIAIIFVNIMIRTFLVATYLQDKIPKEKKIEK